MLPTFVIGLREGLEAALIVGIIAAFLRQRGKPEAIRLVMMGVALAVAICLAFAVGLQLLSASLPQKEQEGLETIVGVVAVITVTYMVLWMRRHARDMRHDLESAAQSALVQGTTLALVGMAFLAVMREGFETSVFLLAALQASGSAVAAGGGAIIGILVAVAIGWGIYRGGVHLNLSKFFQITGVVLVLVAAGLVSSSLHTAHEAGWVNIGQATAIDLSGIIRPGSIGAALFTGVLGMQPKPTVIELLGWLAYLIPVGLFVLWPVSQKRAPKVATVEAQVR